MTTREKILAGALICSVCINWATVQSLLKWSHEPRVGPPNARINYTSDSQYVYVQVIDKSSDQIWWEGGYLPDKAREAAGWLVAQADKVDGVHP